MEKQKNEDVEYMGGCRKILSKGIMQRGRAKDFYHPLSGQFTMDLLLFEVSLKIRFIYRRDVPVISLY